LNTVVSQVSSSQMSGRLKDKKLLFTPQSMSGGRLCFYLNVNTAYCVG
jgi:hypothetical protein